MCILIFSKCSAVLETTWFLFYEFPDVSLFLNNIELFSISDYLHHNFTVIFIFGVLIERKKFLASSFQISLHGFTDIMGTAISGGATTMSFVPEIYHTEFPLHGITLSYVEEFIEAHGGRQAFEEGWTSARKSSSR
jgi:hypothetical protein